MRKIFSIFFITLLYVSISYGQAAVDITLTTVDNGTGNKVLNFGLDLTATTGIDPLLGESDLPPFPPEGVFEARFSLTPYAGQNLSTYKDYRNAPAFPFTGNVQHRLLWQLSENATIFTIQYNLPAYATMQIVDVFGGGLVNSGTLSGSGSFNITNLDVDRVNLNIVYTGAGGTTGPIPGGTYTVGLAAFREATGKDVYFEKRTRTVTKDFSSLDSEVDLDGYDSKSGLPGVVAPATTYTEEYYELMENGQPFNTSFFSSPESRGVYPTITAAVADAILRGIAGPVIFSLVDSNYPTETYPIDIDTIAGASAANTLTIKPGPGVNATIPGSTTQTTATFRIGGGSYVILDGANTIGGTTKNLNVIALAQGTIPAIHLYGAAANNVIKNVIMESRNSSTGSGTFLYGAGPFAADNNILENCTIKSGDTAVVKQAVGVYSFSSFTGANNQIKNCDIVDFSDRGITVQGAPATDFLVAGNKIYNTTASTKTSIYGIYIARAPGLIIEKNRIYNLQSSVASPSIYGIYYIGSSGNPMDVKIQNNLVTISETNQMLAGTHRGIDYFGYPTNSVEIYFNTVYIGGSGVTGGSTYGMTKRDDVLSYKSHNNVVFNNRSNGSGTGKHYAMYFSDLVVTTLEMNHNDYYVYGTGGVLAYYGTADVTTLAEWRTLTSQDANSISADPIFVNVQNDYRPQQVSPLRLAGMTIPGITTDILGATRGTPPTIGAYEQSVFVAVSAPFLTSAIADTFKVTLNWNDLSNNEAGFRIQRKLGDTTSVNAYVTVDSVGPNVTTYVNTGLTPNTTYSYRIFAYNSTGNSPNSNQRAATTLVPVELTSFTGAQNGTAVLLSWTTATELNNKGFDVERKLNETWQSVGFVEGRGTTSEVQNYSFSDDFKNNIVTGPVFYRLKQIDFDGAYAYSNTLEINVDFTPKEYSLSQNYPNPFNPSTKIKYTLPFASNVNITVYNMLGQTMGEIINQVQDAGYYDVTWNASSLSSGIYFYTIDAKSTDGANSFHSVKKMMLVK